MLLKNGFRNLAFIVRQTLLPPLDGVPTLALNDVEERVLQPYRLPSAPLEPVWVTSIGTSNRSPDRRGSPNGYVLTASKSV